MNEPQQVYLTTYQKKIVDLAQNVSHQSQYRTFHHGAVLYTKSTVLNTSTNINRFNSFASKFASNKLHATVHAEIGVILNLGHQTTRGSSVCVVRTNSKNELLNSMPCPMCQSAMSFVGVKECIFSSGNGAFGRIRF